MKKLIPVLLCMVILFTACGIQTVPDSSSDIDNNSQNINSETDSSTPVEIIHKGKVASTDGQYIIYEIDREDPDWMSRSSFHLYNTATGTYTHLADTAGFSIFGFVSDEKCYIRTYHNYREYDMSGNLLFSMGDYFELGDVSEYDSVLLCDVLLNSDGSYIFRYFDTRDVIKLDRIYNETGSNMPFNIKIGIMTTDGTVVKTIDTGKCVETSKSLYATPYFELLDENTLEFYDAYRYYNYDKEYWQYYGTVNLSTGEVSFVDYRPEYIPQ